MHELPFPHLLTELQQWSDDFDRVLKASKAQRVWVKCMRQGHRELAQKIFNKYGRQFPQHDIVIATGWTLIVTEGK